MTEGGGSSSGQAGWADDYAAVAKETRRAQNEDQALSGDHARAALREGRVRQHVEIRTQGSAGAEAVYQASGPGEDNTSIGRK